MPERTVHPTADLLVIGAGPAGLSAVRAYRAHGGAGRVVLIADDPDAPYERPPLSKGFLRGTTAEGEFPLADPAEFGQLGVELVEGRAVGLDPGSRRLLAADGGVRPFENLVLATGSGPQRPPVPGGDDDRLLQLRTLADARRLRAAADGASSAVVVGSGFIGCEAAASLARLGLEVALVTDEHAPQHRRLGPGVAGRITEWLTGEGVRVLPGHGVEVVDVFPDQATVRTGNASVSGELVLLSVGVRPRVDLARHAGLAVEGGRVAVDERMRTAVRGVLAAGDVALARNAVAGRPIPVEHWGDALRMGTVAGATAAGGDAGEDGAWAQVPGFWSEIGDRKLKYAAWGDGWAHAHPVEHGEGRFTVWYTDDGGTCVGVLTHGADDDYETGAGIVEKGGRPPA